MTERLDQDRGNDADYALGTVLGWDAFEVVRWHGVEELSRPFEFEITLRRRTDQDILDLDRLVDSGATFRIASERRWRVVHGIIAEIEELDRTRTFFYYRALLVPPIWRMLHRKRCRTFVERTLKEIVTCVLENRPYPGGEPSGELLPLSGQAIDPPDTHPPAGHVAEPHGRFVWRVAHEDRITHESLHRFVAQYNESDLDFVARLLEHEGITYYFEHGKDSSVMVLTDSPGQDPLHDTDKTVTFRGGAVGGGQQKQELVRWLWNVQRMRSRSVMMREYDYRRSSQLWTGRAPEGEDEKRDRELGHFEFRAKDERLEGHIGEFQARIRLERFEVERRLRQGMSTVRTLLPGHVVEIQDGDGLRDDEEVLIVRVETFATQLSMEGSLLADEAFGFGPEGQALGGYENRFLALHAKVPFRPARVTPRPKIWGVHTAWVWGPDATAIGDANVSKPYDIHCDDMGRVMVRLPWDTRGLQDEKPPSDWCRVSQPWAGGAYGAMHVPRVNHEVLVAYEDGDPDRPVVVGSVYSPVESPPPYRTQSALDKSRTTLKSRSTAVTEPRDGYNELTFTDLEKQEEIYLHAQRNLKEVVLKDHSTTVGGNQSNSVGGNRSHDVHGTESVHVHGDRTTNFDASEKHTVGVNRSTAIGLVEELEVGAIRSVTVHGPDKASVKGDDTTEVGGARTVQVKGDHTVTTQANYHSTANANHTFDSTNMYITQAGEFQVNAATLWLNVGGASLRMSAGNIVLDNGAGACVVLSGGSVFVVAGTLTTMSSGSTFLSAGGQINGTAPNIHLNG
jgi:type VI secretion system secreted protein VgrG